MKPHYFSVLTCLSIFLSLPQTADSQTPGNWQSISVDGLDEWSDPGKWWSSEKGVIVAESVGGKSLPKIHHLIWDGKLKDNFEFRLEYRIISSAPQDAGVYFLVDRSRKVNKKGNLAGYQAELDTANLYSTNRWQREGKLFGHIFDGKRHRMFKRGNRVRIEANGTEKIKPLPQSFQATKVFRKPPEWNNCLVRVKGDMVQLYLNGNLANEIVDRVVAKRPSGDAIALQFRPNGAYRFEVRRLKFRTLD
ncbi:DUF1080 domain-containing protein [Gimesia aquarii]|uniref:3-keto-alpha-glucoside-1,2-lyase/3-keto-2-hydroxy-glucal hydratase domain-containing protein n=1 Tax=Gimesia aquarii TaxID=2527964 RepID=A0A517WU93_9PLAN|nr:DUF1080 domain-containing protein [Gimesia aquarii]QDU08778.1 hypothetical protein V202x_21480 [Gimesia aquarii]